MNEQIDELKNRWKSAREKVELPEVDTRRLITRAEKKKKSTMKLHFLNILILTITLAGISAFFIYVANFNLLISHIGTGLMIGGLVLRILIEFISIFIATKIDLSQTALSANSAFMKFYQFRKKIHGPVTVIILVLYTVGFYMLTPEFRQFFSLPMMVLIDISYIIGAIIFTLNIRKAIRKEMGYLNEIIKIQKDMFQES